MNDVKTSKNEGAHLKFAAQKQTVTGVSTTSAWNRVTSAATKAAYGLATMTCQRYTKCSNNWQGKS